MYTWDQHLESTQEKKKGGGREGKLSTEILWARPTLASVGTHDLPRELGDQLTIVLNDTSVKLGNLNKEFCSKIATLTCGALRKTLGKQGDFSQLLM